MSFYIMSDDGMLVERLDDCPTQADLREWAEDINCSVWVIEGEHAGIGYDLNKPEPARKSTPTAARTARIVFGQPETYPA